MPITQILLATDLSEDSLRVHRYVAALAGAFDAKISLLHVHEPLEFGLLHTSPELANYRRLARECLDRQLGVEADNLRSAGVVVETTLFEGDPTHKIIDFCSARGLSLVAMARHGRDTRRIHLLGSNIKRVVRQLNVPLLMLPTDLERKFRSPPQALVVATDFSEDSARGLRYLLRLAERVKATVTLVHTLRLPHPIACAPGESPPFLPDQILADAKASVDRGLVDWLGDFSTSAKVQIRVVNNHNAARGLVEVADELSADLIALPSHGKGRLKAMLLGSTSEKLLRIARTPVLVLPRAFLGTDDSKRAP